MLCWSQHRLIKSSVLFIKKQISFEKYKQYKWVKTCGLTVFIYIQFVEQFRNKDKINTKNPTGPQYTDVRDICDNVFFLQ